MRAPGPFPHVVPGTFETLANLNSAADGIRQSCAGRQTFGHPPLPAPSPLACAARGAPGQAHARVDRRVDSASMFACDRGCVLAHLFELMPKCLGLRLLSLDALLPLALLVAVLSVFAHRHSVLLEGVASAPRRHTKALKVGARRARRCASKGREGVYLCTAPPAGWRISGRQISCLLSVGEGSQPTKPEVRSRYRVLGRGTRGRRCRRPDAMGTRR